MLFCQEFSRRHECSLQAAAGCARSSRCSNDRFSTADVALQQPHHCVISVQISVNLIEGTCLRASEWKRQRSKEARRELLAVLQDKCGVLSRHAFEEAQAQLVSQQLFKREPALRGVPTGRKHIELRLARRAVHIKECVLQRRKPEWRKYLWGNPVSDGGRLELS